MNEPHSRRVDALVAHGIGGGMDSRDVQFLSGDYGSACAERNCADRFNGINRLRRVVMGSHPVRVIEVRSSPAPIEVNARSDRAVKAITVSSENVSRSKDPSTLGYEALPVFDEVQHLMRSDVPDCLRRSRRPHHCHRYNLRVVP